MATSPIKCPRCSGSITATPDEMGFIVCPACGAKLRSRTPMVVKVQGTAGAPAPSPAPSSTPSGDIDSVLARLDRPPNPTATLPPGTPLKKIPRPGEPGAPGFPAAAPAKAPAKDPATGPATLETILAEVRAMRRMQEELLGVVRTGTAASSPAAADAGDPFTALEEHEPAAPPAPPVRSRRRKTVLLIDDDEKERQAAVEALEHAEVPVTTAKDGNSGLAAIAMEKPDVIVLELDMGGSMGGKDVINLIKATMEWVDIPIVLYTRLPIESQKEARTVHGADEFVVKGSGAPEVLVGRVISLFRRS